MGTNKLILILGIALLLLLSACDQEYGNWRPAVFEGEEIACRVLILPVFISMTEKRQELEERGIRVQCVKTVTPELLK